MTADVHPGTRWVEARRALKMSRERFAEHVGLTPGAVWRIEARGKFKPGEEEKLLAALPDTSSASVIPKQVTPHPAYVWSGDDDEPVQWLDVASSSSARTIASPATATLVLSPQNVTTPFQLSQNDGIIRISNSEIQTFKRCRRKWLLAYYRRLKPRVTDISGVAVIGDRVHRALALWYVPDVTQRLDPRDAIEAVIASDWLAIQEIYARQDGVPLGVETTFKQESDLERIMVEGYVQWLAETGCDADFRVVGSEQYLEADLPGVPNVRLVAKLDARLRRISDGVRIFVDHKTVGDLTTPVRTLSLNEQMLFYLLVESLQDADERCAGAVYNMLRRVKRTPKANPPFYRRVEVYHNPVEVGNFLTRTTGVIHEMLKLREALDNGADHRFVAYPRPAPDCSWSCEYLEIDGMMDDGSRVEDAIADHFVVGDPTAYYAR